MSVPLTVEQIERGRADILANAHALVEEAELLMRHERYARAYALSHLASEELAKLPMLVRAAVELACGITVDWNRLNKRLREHVEKSDLAMDTDFLSGHMPADEYLDTTAQDLNRLKNASLYVGVSATGFVAPAQAVTREMAVGMYMAATRRLRLFSRAEELSRGQIRRIVSNPENRKRLTTKAALQETLKEIVKALTELGRSGDD